MTAAMERFAELEGIELDEVVIELDRSGAKTNESAELLRLIERVERGELDGLVVPKLDRLSRLPARQRVELVERLGAERLLSATESNDVSTPEGRFVRELFFSLARMEWERYARSWDVAKVAAIERGVAVMSVAPFGYAFDAEHRLAVVKSEARIVQALYALRATGASYGDVLELFEKRTGRSSSRPTVAGMLKNRAYLGELRYGRGEAPLVNASAHAPIVELELFERVQALNAERSELGPKRNAGRAKSLLAGIAKCAACGRGLTASEGGHGTRSYKCPNDSRHCSARASILEAELNAYVLEEVVAWAGPVADELVELELELEPVGARVVAEHELAEAERVLRAWAGDVERELADELAYQAGLKARQELVEKRTRALEALGEATEVEIARSTLRQALAVDGDELEVADKRALLAIALESVVVRRTPRRGAPAAERATLRFAATTDGSLEHALELEDEAATDVVASRV
jgi:DNA invertase Pin-like site-specific DNA recombinase